jgi:hypothetical protein
VIRFALSWLLYWAGDLVSWWNDDDRRFTNVGWNLYQWLMRTSIAVQGHTDNGPWSSVA